MALPFRLYVEEEIHSISQNLTVSMHTYAAKASQLVHSGTEPAAYRLRDSLFPVVPNTGHLQHAHTQEALHARRDRLHLKVTKNVNCQLLNIYRTTHP